MLRTHPQTQHSRDFTQPTRDGKLIPIRVTRPGQLWVIDLLSPIWISGKDNRYVLIGIDVFTNWVEAAAMKHMTADEVVLLLIIDEHGMPEGVLSDNGTHLMSHAFESLVNSFKIIKPEASSYHHLTFGKIERFVRFFKNRVASMG